MSCAPTFRRTGAPRPPRRPRFQARILDKIPFAPGVKPVSADAVELLINNTWRPSLAVTGATGCRR